MVQQVRRVMGVLGCQVPSNALRLVLGGLTRGQTLRELVKCETVSSEIGAVWGYTGSRLEPDL